ncbi:uncharacterized protein LOC112049554 [Bicyclus anynana]|uniref:Uncharacterized protein LOC112049554 n=1 Tax=Bicyclus anynana TaxID=110368 RepID=A0A6J1N603_BICAN|nr:uncharacterized protein LOC112049554 [Bicyclus anynana]
MAAVSTPINTVSRENLVVLIRNNVLNNSVEFSSDTDAMETESPVRKRSSLQPIIKKLFHSPISPRSPEQDTVRRRNIEKSRKRRRQEILLPGSEEHIEMAYVKEKDGYSPDAYGGMRKRVLISLFHNKEYSMDIGD